MPHAALVEAIRGVLIASFFFGARRPEGDRWSPAFVRAPEGQRPRRALHLTLKENLLWIRTFHTGAAPVIHPRPASGRRKEPPQPLHLCVSRKYPRILPPSVRKP
jgi:hypothetical protein